MKRVKPVRHAPAPCLDAATVVDQLVTLRIEEDRLRVLLDRIKRARNDAMATLSVKVQEAARTARKAKRKPRARR